MPGLLLVADLHGRRYEIVEDSTAGFYVFAYGEKGRGTHDYLQDALEIAKLRAADGFGVSRDSWRPAKDGERPLYEQGLDAP